MYGMAWVARVLQLSKGLYSFVHYFDSFVHVYEIVPPDAALFFSELTATYNILIRPIAFEIWALEGWSVALVFKHPGFYLDGGAEF